MFTQEEGRPVFSLIKGTARKTTGSYYTHPELVNELIQSALVPVMEERLRNARTAENKQEALLQITVCDPASGSGHFGLAAARRLARELAQIRSGEDEPSPKIYKPALRDIISHCIYGVDRNPLAVELCKVALWLESHAEGKPLSFLDHRILFKGQIYRVRGDPFRDHHGRRLWRGPNGLPAPRFAACWRVVRKVRSFPPTGHATNHAA